MDALTTGNSYDCTRASLDLLTALRTNLEILSMPRSILRLAFLCGGIERSKQKAFCAVALCADAESQHQNRPAPGSGNHN